MIEDKLAYFRGWKAACDDIADFLEGLPAKTPQEIKHLLSEFPTVAQSVRLKGQTALAMAEQTQTKRK